MKGVSCAVRFLSAALSPLIALPALAVLPLDALRDEPPRNALLPLSLPAAPPPGVRVASVEERFGVPTFVWAAPPVARAARTVATNAAHDEGSAELAARRALLALAPIWNLAPLDVFRAVLRNVHDTGRGPVIAAFRAERDGVEVFREEIRVALDRDLSPIAFAGFVAPLSGGSLETEGAFRLDGREATALALADLTGTPPDAAAFVSRCLDARWEWLDYRPSEENGLLVEDVRFRRVWFHLPGRLVPAYAVEMRAGRADAKSADVVAWVVSAADGRLLYRHDLTESDSFSYRVWADTTGLRAPFDGPGGNAGTPHPTGRPDGFQAPFVAPGLVSLESGPIPTKDPWLPAGATVTSGNNADAYADLFAPDGRSSVKDFRAEVTSPGVFDRTYDTGRGPQVSRDQQMAAITQLFYDVNFLHDWYYASGFDEKSGNAQASNYGRGGIENDALLAEAQDYAGADNANMATPSDGGHPRMQMFLWSALPPRSVTVNAPASVAGMKASGTAQFGPISFRVTADAVLVANGGDLHDGCTAPRNASELVGKIAVVDRGNCLFVEKTGIAQANGAVGVLVLNNGPEMVTMSGTDPAVTIPSMLVSREDGVALKQALAGLNVTLHVGDAVVRDGSLDNQVVAHEWGHYISRRLVGDATGISTNMARGLGEGWADFHAMLFTVRADDAAVAANPRWSGAYAATGYAGAGYGDMEKPTEAYYFGMRRVPYSTDFGKDPLTFRHIADGTPLPEGVPYQFGADGSSNSESHNTGEVWGSMLWEGYASLLLDSGRLTFEQARDRMKDILVASYKVTPVNPTLLEARDAVLAAALGFDPADYVLLARAFARRGAGSRAVAPDRYAVDNVPVVESYESGSDIALVSATLDDGLSSCDADGILDDGETGRLSLVLKNVGTTALSASKVVVSSPGAALSFPLGSSLNVAPTMPFGTATVSVPVRLSGVSTVAAVDFSVVPSDPAIGSPATFTRSFRANADDLPARSATDDFESEHPVWIGGVSKGLSTSGWRRVAAGVLDHRFQVLTDGSLSDLTLASPLLEVGASGLRVTFRHRHDFANIPITDQVGSYYYLDGGVLEVSTDGGTTWGDAATLASVPYTGQLMDKTGSALGGRRAFAGRNASWPGFDTVTVDFGSAVAGTGLRFRFRAASIGYLTAGWEVDDVAFSGLTVTPFPVVVPDRRQCLPATVTALSASAATLPAGQPLTLTATVTAASGRPAGSVSFFDGDSVLGAAPLDGTAHATFTTSTLSAGTHSFTASYGGGPGLSASLSAPVLVTVLGSGGTSSTFVPIVLDVNTGSAHFVSELTLTNPGSQPVGADLVYTASMGGGSGVARVTLASGEQKTWPDALAFLRSRGLPVPPSSAGSQGGTLAITFDGFAEGFPPAATVRTFALTASPQPVGAAGLAYGGLGPADALATSATIYGLRSNDTDRSNVAVVATGSATVTLRVTAVSGDGDGRKVVVADGDLLPAGGWKQYSGVLSGAGIANGWVVVERVSGTGSFSAYGVVNDNATNDGSFIPPLAGTFPGSSLTLPVLVETATFRSELVLANRGTAPATFRLSYVESLSAENGAGGSIDVPVPAGTQRIVPRAIDFLRKGGAALGPEGAAGYAGALRISVRGVDLGDVFVGARTAARSPAGGQFGLFIPAIYPGQEASASASLYGLRADASNRSNVAVLHAGDDTSGPVTLELSVHDGSAGGVVKGAATSVTLAPGGWQQIGGLFSLAGVSNGWVTVRRTSGTAPWGAYGVINDGGNPAERTGDGAWVPMTR